jgi:hypothetical protein
MVSLAERYLLLDYWVYKYTWLTIPSSQSDFLRKEGQEVYIVAK